MAVGFSLLVVLLFSIYLFPKVGEYIELKEKDTAQRSQRQKDREIVETRLVTPRVCPVHGNVKYRPELNGRCPCGSETSWGTPFGSRLNHAMQSNNSQKDPELRKPAEEIAANARRIAFKCKGPDDSTRKLMLLRSECLPQPEELGCM